jgi:hypothetical protein
MSEQPTALRLADWAASYNTTMHNKAAAELRRLHAEVNELNRTLALQQQSYEREIQIEVEAEREACAKVCEQQKNRWVDGSDQWGNSCPARLRVTPSSCAAAIRARGNT